MNKLFKVMKKRKEHISCIWKSDTIFRCIGLPWDL